MASEKRDSGYSDSLGRSGHLGGSDNKSAENRVKGSGVHERQCPGGNRDDTPGQVGISNVGASVILTATESGPKGLDSMGGSEFRGRGNSSDGSGY